MKSYEFHKNSQYSSDQRERVINPALCRSRIIRVKIDKINIEVLEDSMADVLKKKTPQERLAIAFNLYHSARLQLTHYLRSSHSDWDDKKIQYEVGKRLSHGVI